jgi:predicted lipase
MITICAFHIAAAMGSDIIHSVYPMASPKVGNQKFVDRFNSMISRCYRIANTRDWVNDVPLGDEFKTVGNDKYVFTSPEIPNAKISDMPYHELITVYLKYGLQELVFSP